MMHGFGKMIDKLKKRFEFTKLEKDYKALKNAKECYEENIEDLLQENHIIQIQDINYDLNDLI